jgi:hypothetical protein
MNDLLSSGTNVRSTAQVAMPQAGRSLVRLCKNFQHKRPKPSTTSNIAFTIGNCRLDAGADVLALAVEAPDRTQLTQLQDVIVRHLLRFDFRKDLQVDWCAA